MSENCIMLMKIAFYQELDKSSLFIHILNNTQMKITVTEFREAKFKEYDYVSSSCRIDITYEVCVNDGPDGGIRTFRNEEDVETYIRFLREKKNDYQKIIKEIEI